MTTRFPSFATDTTADLWFISENTTDDETKLQEEEEKYQNWVTEATKKDIEAPYIGEAANSYIGVNTGEEESDEDDDDDSNEQMGDDDLNELPDSPDEQVIPELDTDDNGIEEDNSWINT